MDRVLINIIGMICLLILQTPVWAQDEPTKTYAFETYLNRIAESEDIVGLAVAIIRDGHIKYMDTFGVRTVEENTPVNRDTVFRIASLSKGMAASIIGQMITEEKVSLSTPVKNFSKEFRLKSNRELNKLTLEHLLTHRTSLPPYAYDNLLEADIAPDTIRKRFAEVDPICPVGTCYAYQNVAFDSVTDLIEEIDGQAFSSSLKQRLFEPLSMTRSSVGSKNLKSDDNWARPHHRRRNQPWYSVNIKEAYYRVPAAGGVNASITDMAEWLKAQMGYYENVLSNEVLELLHLPRVRTPVEIRRLRRRYKHLEDSRYGLGWRIYRYNGHRVISHFGSVDGGYSAQITFLPEKNTGIVILTNSPSREYAEILPTFLNYELGLIQSDGLLMEESAALP